MSYKVNAVVSVFCARLTPAPIQSVMMEMTDDLLTCSSQNIHPVPHVTWATDPPPDHGFTENSTLKITDHKGLYTVESSLRILGNLSHNTYFCSFTSADKTQEWTSSWRNQGPEDAVVRAVI